ncbi:MAG: transcriptional repressor [Oscillospiraceae bacterium]|nr:transcriptional repressor [Oscillospiraceae bacterium]
MDKVKRYSKKREAILAVLRGTKLHPTADWVYQTLKSQYPDLSLGTVYRNLNSFKEEGLITTVGVVDGEERFDANVAPHTHFICSKCYAVIDLQDLPLDQDLDRTVSQKGFQVEGHELVFRGICPHCLQFTIRV